MTAIYSPRKVDWRKSTVADVDPDDDQLAQTPQDVVVVLGFDPLDEGDVQASFAAVTAANPDGHNQYTDKFDRDPPGDPQGGLKHAVLVIGGKRYRAASHLMAAMKFAQENPDADLDDLGAVGEGFETESGHFLDREQAAKYVGSPNRRMSSEEAMLHVKAVNGKLYTLAAIEAAGMGGKNNFNAQRDTAVAPEDSGTDSQRTSVKQ